MGTPMSEVGRTDVGGYVYVIAFASGIVKVGRTSDPRTRLGSIVGHAGIYGDAPLNSWTSPRHMTSKQNEVSLIAAVQAAGGTSDKREYFKGVGFDQVVSLAERLDYPTFDEHAEMAKAGPGAADGRTRLIDRAESRVFANPDHPLSQFFPEAREKGLVARAEASASLAPQLAATVRSLLKLLSNADTLDVVADCLNQLIARGDELTFSGSVIQSIWGDVDRGDSGRYGVSYYDPKIAEAASESPFAELGGAA